MKLKETAILGQGQTRPKISPNELTEIRRHVISGDWSAINAGIRSLADLGLRHSGKGLVWAKSGESVFKADSDTGYSKMEQASLDYHGGLCPGSALILKDNILDVQTQHIDNYCHGIIFSSPAYREFRYRKNGKPLATYAVQIDPTQRKAAPASWIIYRHPRQQEKYSLLHVTRHADLIKECECQGWKREPIGYLGNVVRDNAEFGLLMGRLGYVRVRTAQISGRKECFWLYRTTSLEAKGNTPLCPQERGPHKASPVTVQASETKRFAFTRVAVDGRYLWVYDDHIRYLKKIRTRIGGKQVQGYSAKNSKLVIEGAKRGLCPDNKPKSGDILPAVQAASTKYTPALLASMAPAEILAAAKDTLIAINGKSGVGMVAHSIMLKHGGRNLASVPQANLAECLADLDKLLNLPQVEEAA